MYRKAKAQAKYRIINMSELDIHTSGGGKDLLAVQYKFLLAFD